MKSFRIFSLALLLVLPAMLTEHGMAQRPGDAKPKPAPKSAPKKNEEKPAKPPSQPPAEPAPAQKADLRDVLKFRDFRSAAELAAKLPKAMVNPQLIVHLTALPQAYPNALAGVAPGPDKRQLFVVTSDGSRHLYDDGRTKSGEQRLNEADIEDMFFYNYPLANPTDRLPADFDPGRARPESLFKVLYGDSPAAVQKNLVSVSFAGKKIPFNRQNGASVALERVGQDLEGVVSARPELKVWLTNLGGAYNWRKIDGTERLSTHSFGIAIDLNTAKSKYWRWEKPSTLASFSRKDFPAEIIEVFERHGFVWGGKWYHYDTMHFEYRPEILHAARLTGGHAAPPVKTTGNTTKEEPDHKETVTPAPAPPPPASVEPAVQSRRRALVVETAADATNAGKLKEGLEQCGFSVELLTAPGLAALVDGMQRLTKESAGTEALLFHFSGEAKYHDNKTYLVPAGATIRQPDDVFAEGLALHQIVEPLTKARAEARIVLLDTPPGPPVSAEAEEIIGQQFMVPGFFFGFAASSATGAQGAWRPRLFTGALAAKVASPRLSVADLFTVVTSDVGRSSGGVQKPQSTSTLSSIFRFSDGNPRPGSAGPTSLPQPAPPQQAPPKPAPPADPAASKAGER